MHNRCCREVGGRNCRSQVTWIAGVFEEVGKAGRKFRDEYAFCTRHKKVAEKMPFWRGTVWRLRSPASGGTVNG